MRRDDLNRSDKRGVELHELGVWGYVGRMLGRTMGTGAVGRVLGSASVVSRPRGADVESKLPSRPELDLSDRDLFEDDARDDLPCALVDVLCCPPTNIMSSGHGSESFLSPRPRNSTVPTTFPLFDTISEFDQRLLAATPL